MKEFDPVVKKVKFERAILTRVTRVKEEYEISHGHWSFYLTDQNNPKKVRPKVGDHVIFYGRGVGHEIQGIQINQNLLYYVTDAEVEAKRQKWIEETRARNKKEYDELMVKIKDEEPFTTVDISGFGSGYERACQLALRAGYKWLQEHPDFKFNVTNYRGITGIANVTTAGVKDYEKLLKDFDKAMLDAVDHDMTGAMHQAVINHLEFINATSWDEWLKESKDRTYKYPSELPPPSF